MTSNRPYLLRAVHEWICDNGLTPYIVVDASHAGVRVPPQAVSEGRVVLNIAPRAVARLDLGNEVIACMARFGGVSQSISVPLGAVQAIYARENGQGMLMAEDAAGALPALEPSDDGSPAPATPALQAVPAAGQQDADSGSKEPPDAGEDSGKPKPKGKPTLRVIK